MQGILLVDKPTDWTSFDVVNYVRKLVAKYEGKKPKNFKVGHTGTLDPFATGLLIILIGKDYTKRTAEFSKLDKTYDITMKIGETSSTGDPEGEITQVSDSEPSLHEIKHALDKFKGEITQIPPAYSAIKIDGQRAYKLARAGKEVNIEPRQVAIQSLELKEYKYPELKLVANVSSGTYIRTLAEDIGEELGTGAYTTKLRRTMVNDFKVGNALGVQNISAEQIIDNLHLL